MSALPARGPDPGRAVRGSAAAGQWAQLRAAAPQAAATMQRYLQRLAVFLAPASVDAADGALRQFARWMTADAGITAVSDIRRDDIEDYKVWLAAQPRAGGKTISMETRRQRIRTVRAFFERIIEWDWPDAPPRNPVIAWDIPKKPEPLPKFLDDRDAARLMAAARAAADPRDRLVVELLARTGMRAGELAGLEAGAVVRIGDGHWLRIPLGKLRNDRYVPLHPELVQLLAVWTAANLEHIRRHKRLVADHRGLLDRYVIGRAVARVARAAGVPGVHPHRLRHTLATQAINRGMRLEAIAALLGHQKMEMTLIYANPRELHQAGEETAGRQVTGSPEQCSGRPYASHVTWEDPAVIPSDARFAHQRACIRRESQKRSDEGSRGSVARVRSPGGAFSGFQYPTPPLRIANRVVADEYAAVSAKIDALYGQPPQLPADYETAGMARLRREAHARMLGNGLCTRPAELDCRMESACETCAYFRTGTEFLPVLVRQRDHARHHGQADRTALFDGLIQHARAGPATTGRS